MKALISGFAIALAGISASAGGSDFEGDVLGHAPTRSLRKMATRHGKSLVLENRGGRLFYGDSDGNGVLAHRITFTPSGNAVLVRMEAVDGEQVTLRWKDRGGGETSVTGSWIEFQIFNK